jgi:hypothetical protein
MDAACIAILKTFLMVNINFVKLYWIGLLLLTALRHTIYPLFTGLEKKKLRVSGA